MKTSWSETRQTDEYLLGQTGEEDRLVFEAKLLLHPSLHDTLAWQQKTHDYIRRYGRKQLKAELEAIYRNMEGQKEHADFLGRLRQLFKK